MYCRPKKGGQNKNKKEVERQSLFRSVDRDTPRTLTMPKAAKQKKAASGSGPYDRKQSKSAAASTNIFRFNKDFGQHILKNPGIRLACSY
jgi:hypothetical protein